MNAKKKTALLMLLALTLPGTYVVAGDSEPANRHHAVGLVKTVIDNVSQYWNLSAALQDGYVLASGCVSGPDGGMGVHYARPDLIGDGILDPATPELLVYEPQRWGNMRLVAVDYLMLKSTWEEKNGVDVPAILDGQHMMFAGYPNRYALPAFYLLHVWAFKHNRNGMFAMYNPDVTCEYYAPAPVG